MSYKRQHLFYNIVITLTFFAILTMLNACKGESKAPLDGNPVLSDNGKLVPTLPLEEPVKDTSTLHEIRKLTESVKGAASAAPAAATPATPPPTQPAYTAPPPPPPSAPKPVDMSGITKVVEALQNIDQLDQRATAAMQAATKAEQRAKAAQQAANLAKNSASDKKCADLASIKKEADNADNAADKVAVKADGAQKSAEKVSNVIGDVRQKLSQINTNLSRGADMNTTLTMAQAAQASYTKVIGDLAKAEAAAEAAANEAKNAEIAAYNAKNMEAGCKTPKNEAPALSVNKNKIKTNLEQNLMDLSRNPRNVRIMSDIKDNFGNFTQKGVIATDKGGYSVEQYMTKLNLSGAMDIQITDIAIDSDGKVTHVEIEETKLGK